MSRSATIHLPFDEERPFRLGIGQLEELQERTDAGPEELYARLGAGRWRVADVQQTLRLGLIGAGLAAVDAKVLVDRYAGPGQLIEWKDHCRAILYAAMAGAPDEDGESPSGELRGEATTTVSPAASSASDASTKSAAP